MKLDLTRAELGLATSTILEAFIDDPEATYEIVTTGAVATLGDVLKKFTEAMLNPSES